MYDSLYNCLKPTQKTYINALFPHLAEFNIQYPSVQRQPNGIDCGLYAIAFATSLALKMNPSLHNYVPEMMRTHLRYMILSHDFLPFPFTARSVQRRSPVNLFGNAAFKLETQNKKKNEKKQRQRSTKKITVAICKNNENDVAEATSKIRSLSMNSLADGTFSYVLDPNNVLEDDVVREFHEKLSPHTTFRPQEVGLFEFPKHIEPVPPNESQLQIIYDGDVGLLGHCSCIYYITTRNR